MSNMLIRPFEAENKDGLTIRGSQMVLKDKAGDRLPTIILSHGFTATMEETLPYATKLAEYGNRVYLYDFCGGSWRSSSDGSFSDYMSVETEKGDLLQVLAWVRQNPLVDDLFFLGCSQGGFVSVLAAAEISQELDGLILLYPALCIPDDARRGHMQTMVFDPHNVPDHVGTGPIRVSRRYVTDAAAIDLNEELSKIHCPVLILHGTGDAIVPVHYAQDAAAFLKQKGVEVTLHIYPGADHGFHNQSILDDVVSRIEAFIQSHLSQEKLESHEEAV